MAFFFAIKLNRKDQGSLLKRKALEDGRIWQRSTCVKEVVIEVENLIKEWFEYMY